MRSEAPDATRKARRRSAGLLLVSAVFHVIVLGGFALRLPAIQAHATPPEAMDVTLVEPPPFIRPLVIERAEPPPPQTRVVVLETPPRYAPRPAAVTGSAADAVDLFGPVFADGMWPRPILVKSEPCDPKLGPDEAADCRRELMLIGLASDAAAGAKAAP